MLLAVAAACSSETIEVPGETVVVEKEVVKTVEVPGETVTVEVVKEVQVPGETVVVKEEVVKEVMVPGETVVVEKEVVKTVEVPGETVTVEVVKEVQVPGETVVVEKVVTETVEVPGETVVVEKEVVKEVEVPGETITVTKEVIKEVMVPGETVTVTKEVVKIVEVPGETVVVAGPERVVVKEIPGVKYVTDPTTGKAVTAPQYGGTFTNAIRNEQEHADPWFKHGPGSLIAAVAERLGVPDWAIERDKYSHTTEVGLATPLRGQLAESWETPDAKTIVFNIREGVYWHDKAPMNGRELDAYDIEYNFHRVLGLGSGFTEPSPTGSIKNLPFESIAATDKWTVVMKLKEPRLEALTFITTDQTGYILPPEVIKQYGDVKDWRNLVTTGPYMLTDLVDGSSITYEKNPFYWGYDEKYPENRLPYTDKIRTLVMPEEATIAAALRTRQLDFTGVVSESSIKSLDQAQSLQRTNPEIVQWPWLNRSDNSFATKATKPPFDDLRVRKAMQMALDLETIKNTYFKGLAVSTPYGWVRAPGYHIPFAEWPEEVKKGYMYDPEGAEALLDAAGLTRGSDGIRFKTDLTHYISFDLNYVQIAAEYWKAIGVDVEIDVVDGAGLTAGRMDPAVEGMFTAIMAVTWSPTAAIRQSYSTGGWVGTRVKDSDYDAMVDAAEAATTVEEQKRLVREGDMYAIERHWYIWGPMVPSFILHQPWLKGYNGEIDLGSVSYGQIYARLWIDSEMKAAMGY